MQKTNDAFLVFSQAELYCKRTCSLNVYAYKFLLGNKIIIIISQAAKLKVSPSLLTFQKTENQTTEIRTKIEKPKKNCTFSINFSEKKNYCLK